MIIDEYVNDTPIIEISNISNLCITKRTINSSKGNKINYNYDR